MWGSVAGKATLRLLGFSSTVVLLLSLALVLYYLCTECCEELTLWMCAVLYCAVACCVVWPQELLDTLDCHKRFINPAWKDWGDVEDGGILKPSRVLAAAAAGSSGAAASEAGGQTQLQQ